MKAVRVLTGFLAFIFCVALWGLEIGAAALGVSQHLFSGDGVAEIMKNVDVKEVLASQSDSGDYRDTVKKMVGEEFFGAEINDELIEKFLESQTFEDLTALVGDAVISYMLGGNAIDKLTPEALRKIFDDNAVEIVTLIDGEYSEEREAEIRAAFDAESEAVFAEIDVGSISDSATSQIDENTLNTARFALKPSTLYIALAACAALTLIIAALRLRRFGWLLWIGITTFLAGGLTLCVGLLIGPVLKLIAKMPTVISDLSGVIGARFMLTGAIMLGAALLCIVLVAVLRAATRKIKLI